jgi:hypothetical protein
MVGLYDPTDYEGVENRQYTQPCQCLQILWFDNLLEPLPTVYNINKQ